MTRSIDLISDGDSKWMGMDKIQRRYLAESGEAASMPIEISSKGLISPAFR